MKEYYRSLCRAITMDEKPKAVSTERPESRLRAF
jgi:hypothetical protein